MGRPPLADDPRFATMAGRHANNEALEGIIGEWTAGLTNWEVTERLQKAGRRGHAVDEQPDDRGAPSPAGARRILGVSPPRDRAGHPATSAVALREF